MTRDDERRREADAERDARLSALLDGELDEPASAALRAAIADDPLLAERVAALGEVDGQIRQLAAVEPDPARLARLRGELQRRLDVDADAPVAAARVDGTGRRAAGDANLAGPVSGRRRSRRPVRPSRTWVWAPLAAALAAAVLLSLWGTAPRTGSGIDATKAPAPVLADRSISPGTATQADASPMPEGDRPEPSRLADRTPPASAGPGPITPDGSVAVATRSPLAEPGGEALDVPRQDGPAAALVDEELAVALQYDVLADLETLENLELLELLAMLDETESL